MFREIILADPILVVDLEYHQVVRIHALAVAKGKRMRGNWFFANIPPDVEDRESPTLKQRALNHVIAN